MIFNCFNNCDYVDTNSNLKKGLIYCDRLVLYGRPACKIDKPCMPCPVHSKEYSEEVRYGFGNTDSRNSEDRCFICNRIMFDDDDISKTDSGTCIICEEKQLGRNCNVDK